MILLKPEEVEGKLGVILYILQVSHNKSTVYESDLLLILIAAVYFLLNDYYLATLRLNWLDLCAINMKHDKFNLFINLYINFHHCQKWWWIEDRSQRSKQKLAIKAIMKKLPKVFI